MRFVHTSDWHLGRLFHGRHLTEDQALVLDQLVDLLVEVRADALLISGDVYDRAVPPVEAVRLLDDVLQRIVLGLKIPVLAIAGNHDSPERLAFGSAFLAERGLHVAGAIDLDAPPVTLQDAHGPVQFHLLPYAEPAVVRIATGNTEIHTHDAAVRAMVTRTLEARTPNARQVALAHLFMAGGSESDSERALSVGGAAQVATDALGGFDYVALGHLHRPQRAGGSDAIRYSGSLLKYSFNEAGHKKSVLVVEMDATGACTYEAIPLRPRRDVRILEGSLGELLQGPRAGECADDYVLAKLTDTQELLHPMAKLRGVYPNACQLMRLEPDAPRDPARVQGARRERPLRDLFRVFYEEVTGADLDEAHREALDGVLTSMDAGPSEGDPA